MKGLTIVTLVLFVGLALVGANVLNDVENIESELQEDNGSENLKDTEEIRQHLEQALSETCHSFLSDKYDEYFTPNAVFNVEGEKHEGKQDFQQDFEGVDCQTKTYAIWDIERHGDHAIASLKFEAESDIPMKSIVIHELVKENEMWKTELVLDFGHVDFSSDGNDLNSDETAIYEALKLFSNLACTAAGESGYESQVFSELFINMGGRKLHAGLAGTREGLRLINSTRCEIDNFKIVDVEVGTDAAIAMVTGHIDVDKKEHPFLEAFEFRKDSEDKWTIDTILVFLHVSGL